MFVFVAVGLEVIWAILIYVEFVLESWLKLEKFPESKKQVGKMSSDPISDMFSQLRNGWMVKRKNVVIPHSKLKFELLKKLEEKKLIKKIEIENRSGGEGQKKIIVELSYLENKQAPIETIKIISKPSRRWYAGWRELRSGWAGSVIVSTSRGLLFDNEARRQKLGGEVIVEII